jgi:glycosyltransferase involved in cell wall biosynthesis
VLDIRAGSYRSSYESRGPLYRAGCRAVLRAADLIVSQDPKTVDYLRRLTGRSAEYVPNHTECVSAAEPSRPEPGAGDEVRLIYFGAMRMEKGIDRIVTACGWLVRRGQPASLTLIGASQPRVRAEIEALACANGITSFVAIHPPVSPDELRGLCAHGHFFLFPTRWIGEGHSNSLTEAMAWGLVPIASDWGCNALVVGDAGRVLRSSASGEEYAAAIEEIWTRREWKTLSDLSRERVRRLYSTDVVLPRLIHLLDGIDDVRSRPQRRREPGPLRRSASPPDA